MNSSFVSFLGFSFVGGSLDSDDSTDSSSDCSGVIEGENPIWLMIRDEDLAGCARGVCTRVSAGCPVKVSLRAEVYCTCSGCPRVYSSQVGG